MGKLPLVGAKTFEKLLLHFGFDHKGQKGSHVFYRHPDGRDMGRPLTRTMLRQIEITPEESIELLDKI